MVLLAESKRVASLLICRTAESLSLCGAVSSSVGWSKVQHFTHSVETLFPDDPFGSEYRTEGKPFAGLGFVPDAEYILFAFPLHGVYSCHFPLSDRGDGNSVLWR